MGFHHYPLPTSQMFNLIYETCICMLLYLILHDGVKAEESHRHCSTKSINYFTFLHDFQSKLQLMPFSATVVIKYSDQ